MVIKGIDDIRRLIDERIEAMEDLDCKDLKVCVLAFTALTGAMTLADQAKYAHAIRPIEGDREIFEKCIETAEASVSVIDQLTLKTDTAE